MTRTGVYRVVAGMLTAAVAGAAWAQIAPQRCTVNSGGQVMQLPCDWNMSPQVPNPNVTRAVIVVHSSGLDATDAMTTVLAAANAVHPTQAARTLIVAPQFLEDSRCVANQCDDGITEGMACSVDTDCIDPTLPHWTGGWRRGNPNVIGPPYTVPSQISSFAVLDQLVLQVTSPFRFPNLKQVVILGHSAGAQTANNYAAGTRIESILPAGIAMRYVGSAPGRKIYFDNKRWNPGSQAFDIPITCLDDYNSYSQGYGLDGLNSYMRNVDPGDALADIAMLRSQYEDRHVVLVVGSNDLDAYESCGGFLQGGDHVVSHDLYQLHLIDTFGPTDQILVRHPFETIQGVGHTTDIYVEPDVSKHIFAIFKAFDGFDYQAPPQAGGWFDSPDNAGGTLVGDGARLVPTAPGTSAGVFRPLPFSRPVNVRARLTETDGAGLQGGAYAHGFRILSDGSTSSGYGIQVWSSGDSAVPDSGVILHDGTAVLGQVLSPFAFGARLDLDVTIHRDGRVNGTLRQDDQTFEFSFGPLAYSAGGEHFVYHTQWDVAASQTAPGLEVLQLQLRPAVCSTTSPFVDDDRDGIEDGCDNCAVANDTQDDADLDGVGDACDNCVDGFNPAQGPAIFSQTIRFSDAETIVWPVEVQSTVVRGDLAEVASYRFEVLIPLPPVSTFEDSTLPLAGAGFYYLVKPGSVCASPSWQSSLGNEPLRDASLP